MGEDKQAPRRRRPGKSAEDLRKRRWSGGCSCLPRQTPPSQKCSSPPRRLTWRLERIPLVLPPPADGYLDDYTANASLVRSSLATQIDCFDNYCLYSFFGPYSTTISASIRLPPATPVEALPEPSNEGRKLALYYAHILYVIWNQARVYSNWIRQMRPEGRQVNILLQKIYKKGNS